MTCSFNFNYFSGQGNYDSLASFQPVNGDLAGEHVVHVSSRADTVLAVNSEYG